MKIKICDVCYRGSEERPLVPAKYRISYKDGKGGRIAMDVCQKHQDFFRKCKSFEEAYSKYEDVLFGG